VLDAADVEVCHALLALDDAFKETGAELREPVSSSMVTNIIGPPRRPGPGGLLRKEKPPQRCGKKGGIAAVAMTSEEEAILEREVIR